MGLIQRDLDLSANLLVEAVWLVFYVTFSWFPVNMLVWATLVLCCSLGWGSWMLAAYGTVLGLLFLLGKRGPLCDEEIEQKKTLKRWKEDVEDGIAGPPPVFGMRDPSLKANDLYVCQRARECVCWGWGGATTAGVVREVAWAISHIISWLDVRGCRSIQHI